MRRVGLFWLVAVSVLVASCGAAWAWTAPVTLSGPAVDGSSPDVGIAADQSSVFVWQRAGVPSSLIQVRSRSGSGVWGAMQTLSSGDSPDMAVNAAGTTAIVFRKASGLEQRVWLVLRDSSGAVTGPAVLSPAGADADQPAVGIASDGTVVAAWRRAGQIQLRVRQADGSLGPIRTVGTAAASDPAVAVAPGGAAAVVWRRDRGTDSIVELARPDGTVIGLAAGGVATSPLVGIDDDGDAVAAWLRGGRLQSRTVLASGFAGAIDNASPAGVVAEQPALAVNPSGAAAFAWRQSDGSSLRAYGRHRSPSNAFGPRQLLSGRNADARSLQVDLDNAGKAVAAWDRRSATRTYAQARSFFADGSLGRLITVSATTEDVDSAPSVDLNETGGAAMGWLRSDGANPRVRGAVGAPRVRVDDAAIAYTEGEVVPIDDELDVLDEDAELTGARIAIASGYVNGEDVLGFSDQNGITGDFDAANGVLTLSGAASLADYETALRSVTYSNASEDPSTATRTLSVQAADAAYAGDVETRALAITGVNDAPEITTPGTTQTYTENGAPVAVDESLTVTDSDSADLEGAAATIQGFVSGDRLNFTDQNGIGGDFDAATHTLTLAGTASVADYETALRSVTFDSTSDDPSGATRTIDFVVADSDGASSPTDSQDVDVTPVNDKPVVTTGASALAYTENDAASVIDGAVTVADVDSSTLQAATVQITGGYVNGEDVLSFDDTSAISSAFDSATGTLTLTGAASPADYQAALRLVRYRNASEGPSTADRAVSFQVDDGAAADNLSDPATQTIHVATVNDAPAISTPGATQTYTENGAAVAVDSTLTVTDSDSANLQGATAVIQGFVAGDRLNFTNQNGITGVFDAGTHTLTLTGTTSVANYQTALRSVTFDSTSDDPTGAARTIDFKVTDSDGAGSATDSQTVNVTPVNDAPVVDLDAPGALSYTEQAGFVNISGPAATVSDVDSSTLDSLVVSISSGFDATFDALRLDPALAGFTVTPGAGTITITRAGGTPAQFTSALRAIQFRNTDDDPDDRNDGTPNPTAADRTLQAVADDGPDTSAPATRNLTITPVNDAPSAPSTAPTVNSVRNTTLVSGTNSVTDPKVTRTVDFKSNSTDPDGLESAIVVQAVTNAATTQGGRITLTNGGDLRYEPPASATLASDTYGYQLSDSAASSPTVTFTVNLAGVVWYVADQAGAPNDGSAARPFATLAAALAVASINQAIHIRRAPGDGTLTAGVTLQSGQKLLGEGVALTSGAVGAPAGDTLFASGTKPVLTATNADVLTLANSNEIAGLSLNPDGGGGGLAGTNPTGVTVRDSDITDTGTQATQPGIELTTGGGLTFSGTVTISTTQSRALDLTGTALSGTLANTTVSGGTNGAVNLVNTTGGLTVQTLGLTTTGGTGFRLSNAANVDVDGTNFATTVSSSGGPAVDATTLTNGTDLAFDTVTVSGTPTKGVNLDGSGGWTFSAGSGSAIGATSQVGLAVNGGSGAVSYAGTITNGSGRPIDVTGRTGNTTISGNITGTGGTGINVSGNTAGTTTLSGTTKTLNTGTNQAVTLSSNTGHTIAFTNGGLDIDTSTGTGYSATGGGTVTVQGTGNTINASTGSGIVIRNTTVGAAGVTFRSISSGGSGNAGIVLDTTGGSGGLTVTGLDGADADALPDAGSGGTIVNKTGANIQNMVAGVPVLTGTTGGTGVFLKSTTGASLSGMQLNDFSNYALYATGSSNVTLADSTVSGANGDDIAQDESAVGFFNQTGSAAVTRSSISGGVENNLWIVNTSGTLSRFTLASSTLGFNNTTSGNNNVLVEGRNAGTTLNFTVKGSTFKGARADWLTATNNSNSSMDVVVGGDTAADGNTFDNLGANAHPGAAPGGNRVVVAATGPMTYNISNNTLKGSKGSAIFARSTGTFSGITGSATGRIANNVIGVAATANSGSSESSGIDVEGDGGSDHTTLVSGNHVFQYNNHGILVLFGDEINNGSVFNATVTSNTVNTPGNINSDFNAFHLNNGTVAATDDFTTCLELANNSFTGGGQGTVFPNNADERLRQRQSTTVRLPGYGGPARDNSDNQVAEVVTFLRPPASGGAKSNTFGTGAAGSVSTGGGYVGTGGACATP